MFDAISAIEKGYFVHFLQDYLVSIVINDFCKSTDKITGYIPISDKPINVIRNKESVMLSLTNLYVLIIISSFLFYYEMCRFNLQKLQYG